MSISKQLWTLGFGSTLAVAMLGCENDRVAMDEVEDARIEAREAEAELQEAEEAAAERIERKRVDLQEALAEEEAHLADERAEARQAQAEAQALTQTYQTQQAREQFVEKNRIALEEAEREIARLDDRGKNLQGPELDEHNTRIDHLNGLHADAEAAQNDLEAAAEDIWDLHRQQVENALARLNSQLRQQVNVEVRVDDGILDLD